MPTSDDIYNGVVTVDVPLAIEAALHISRSLELLHAAGLVHGDISDSSVLVSMCQHRSSPDERMALGERLSICFATLGEPGPTLGFYSHSSGLVGGSMGLPAVGSPVVPTSQDALSRPTPPSSGPIDDPSVAVHLDDLAATRIDLPMFYAPERFDRSGKLLETIDPSADMWALGMLLMYMLRVSLPLLRDGPLVRPPTFLRSAALCLSCLCTLQCFPDVASAIQIHSSTAPCMVGSAPPQGPWHRLLALPSTIFCSWLVACFSLQVFWSWLTCTVV